MRAAYQEGKLHSVRSSLEEKPHITRCVLFSENEVFSVMFQHKDIIDSNGEVAGLMRETRAEAKKHGIILLSDIEVIDACGAGIVAEWSEKSGANAKI